MKAITLSAIQQGIQRLRSTGSPDPQSLYDLENGYVVIDGSVKQRPGTQLAFTLPAGTLGMCAHNGDLVVFSTSPKVCPAGVRCEVLTHPFFPSQGITYIWFAAPFLGFLYVVAEFQNGDVYHYWLQAQNKWAASTMYREGQIIVPTVANGLGYKATRRLPPDQEWAPGLDVSLGTRVEPTDANGFYYISVGVGAAGGVGTPGGTPIPGTPGDPTGDGAAPIIPTVSEPSGFNKDMSDGASATVMEFIGNIPDMYVGVPVVLNLVNGNDPFRVRGGWSPDRIASGTVVPGVQPWNFAGGYPQVTGTPTTAGTYTTALQVRGILAAQSVTVAAKPAFSLPDWSTRLLLDSLTYAETTPPLTTAVVTSYAESQYSPSPGQRSLATFTAGKRKGEFIPTMQVQLGITTRNDLLVDAATVKTHSLPAGTYAVEVNADVSPATYQILNVALAVVASGSLTLPAGSVFRFFWYPLAKGQVKANYGNEAWAVATTVGFAGLPMLASTTYIPKWDASTMVPVGAFTLSDPYQKGIPTRVQSPLPFDNFIRWDIGHSTGKRRWLMRVLTNGNTQRTGMCQAGFSRAAGMLGQAGTANSIGWRAPARDERAYRLEWCFGGVHSQILVDDPYVGQNHDILMAYDATAATVMVLHRIIPSSYINIPAFTLLHTIPGVPAGTWFPAVTGQYGCFADMDYDEADSASITDSTTTSTYDPWTTTL